MAAATRRAGSGNPEDDFRWLLRNLRESAGYPTLRSLSNATSLSATSLHAIFSAKSRPSRQTLERLLAGLGASSEQAAEIRRAWEEMWRADDARRAGGERSTGQERQTAARSPGSLVINSHGGTVYISPADAEDGSPSHKPPALIQDMDGHALKPDPLEATTFDELIQLMQAFRAWAGHPSTRDLAHLSGGEFSHATISKLLSTQPSRKPPLKLGYVRGFIRACGGDDDEQKRWITAWRRIDQGKATHRAPHASNVVAMKPSTGNTS